MISLLPTLTTERLVLRPLTLAHAPAVQRLAGAREVADTTLTVPHPYPDGVAEAWIAMHPDRFAAGDEAVFGITLRETGELMGVVGLVSTRAHRRAELGYWMGVPFWGRGFCTEAARAAVRFALTDWEMSRVTAHHFTRNPASGAVLLKAGMMREGMQRRHVLKNGVLEDIEMYGILREELDAPRGA
jgi:RimJ/RimL family protein N-acetyltransferase